MSDASEEWYACKADDGSWRDGPYDSRDEAIDAMAWEYAQQRGCPAGEAITVYTGRADPYRPDIDAIGHVITDHLVSQANDVSSDSGPWEDWLHDVPPEDEKRLDELIRDAVSKWLDETCNWPSWHLIEDMEGTEVIAPAEQGDPVVRANAKEGNAP